MVPVYNEESVLATTYRRIKDVMKKTGKPYELLFVNDGSTDGSQRLLDGLRRDDQSARVLNFSRNFGHQTAITAGLDHARGDAVVVIDADLQDPPELIPAMIERWRDGFDVVYARRTRREGESVFKRFSAAVFYRSLRFLTDVDIPADSGDFRLIDRKVCDALKTLPERSRFVRGLVAWAGFRQTALEYVREPRLAGQSNYTVGKMLHLGMDAITAFSDKPLKLALCAGASLALMSLVGLIVVIMVMLTAHTLSLAWVLVLILVVINSIALLSLGFIGQYVARIYEEVRHRPLYILDPIPPFEEDEDA